MLSKRIALISIVFDAFADSYAKEQTRSIEGRRLTATTTYVHKLRFHVLQWHAL